MYLLYHLPAAIFLSFLFQHCALSFFLPLILVLVLFLILGLLVQCAVRLVLTVPLSVSSQLVTIQRLLQVQWEQWE
jgi:hypothetical protein